MRCAVCAPAPLNPAPYPSCYASTPVPDLQSGTAKCHIGAVCLQFRPAPAPCRHRDEIRPRPRAHAHGWRSNLGYNLLSSLPPSLFALRNLSTLYANNNRIEPGPPLA